jgi:hypothetical protein
MAQQAAAQQLHTPNAFIKLAALVTDAVPKQHAIYSKHFESKLIAPLSRTETVLEARVLAY